MRFNLVSPMMVVCKDFCHICYAFVFGRDITRSMGESQGGYAQDKKASQKEALTNSSPTYGHLCIDLKIPFTFFS
jgi:hypothetical protein